LKNLLLEDHLGNVRATLSDYRQLAQAAKVTSATDYYPFGMVARSYVGPESYRYGYGTQEKDTDIGEGIYTAEYWEYDSRLGRRWNLDPKPRVNISSYSVFDNNPIENNDVDGDKPTPEEAARMSAHVYGNKTDDILIGDWKVSKRVFKNVTLANDKNGFKSQVYERIITEEGPNKGKTEYVYVTAGTDDFKDVLHDIIQPLGISGQYKLSMDNAKAINEQLNPGEQLSFAGHSLGGGEAAANAFATGRDAITFNAAGVSRLTRNKKKESELTSKSTIDAYIMLSDPLNLVQNHSETLIGILMPNVDGKRHYLQPSNFMTILNGHVIDNTLRAYGIDPSIYAIPKQPKQKKPK